MRKITLLGIGIGIGIAAILTNKEGEKINVVEAATAPIRPITEKATQRIAKDFSEYALKGTSYEKHAQDRQLKQDKQTLRVTRSVKECIKPGGLIDDEVQMCVNGTREKTW